VARGVSILLLLSKIDFQGDLPMDDINIDCRYNSKKQPSKLSEDYRYFLKHGKVSPESEYSEGQINTIIQEKVKDLPTRVQNIIDDIIFLTKSSEFEFPSREIWSELQQTEHRFESNSDFSGNGTIASEENTILGYELAHALRSLYPESEQYGLEDLFWGLFLGLIDQSNGKEHIEHQRAEHLLTHVERNYRNRRARVGRDEDLIDVINRTEKEEVAIREAFRESDFEYYRKLGHEITSRLRKQGIKITKENVLSQIQKLNNESQLSEIRGLEQAVWLDWRIIKEKSRGRSINIFNILELLWDSNVNSSREIDRELEERSEQNIVTTILKDLAGRKSLTERKTPYYDILNENTDTTWEFTAYGKVVSTELFDKQMTRPWKYDYVVEHSQLSEQEREFIESALEENEFEIIFQS
jgi:predicted transcriptional regulator